MTGATWTGNLPVDRFIEFPFVAVNPSSDARLVWPVVQVYADGERVQWSGPEGSETPASVTIIRNEGVGLATILASAALLLALVAAGLALRGRFDDREGAAA